MSKNNRSVTRDLALTQPSVMLDEMKKTVRPHQVVVK